ncbi:transcriptional repressor [Anaerotignum sp.]|nr:transcriptional repressor [Anaerotignum sp.]
MKHATNAQQEDPMDLEKFRIQMQREMILQKLKEGGYRITKQRTAVIDIILENDCGSCKEIFYKTAKINKKIGAATIYRTINMLEEIGAINRRNLYKLSDLTENGGDMVIITLEDGEELQLTSEEWNEVLQTGMQACGYLEGEKIVSVVNGCAVGA